MEDSMVELTVRVKFDLGTALRLAFLVIALLT
jgi:hypothetical protein